MLQHIGMNVAEVITILTFSASAERTGNKPTPPSRAFVEVLMGLPRSRSRQIRSVCIIPSLLNWGLEVEPNRAFMCSDGRKAGVMARPMTTR